MSTIKTIFKKSLLQQNNSKWSQWSLREKREETCTTFCCSCVNSSSWPCCRLRPDYKAGFAFSKPGNFTFNPKSSGFWWWFTFFWGTSPQSSCAYITKYHNISNHHLHRSILFKKKKDFTISRRPSFKLHALC